MLNGKELQIGKRYKTRDNRVVTLIEFVTNNRVYRWKSDLSNLYDCKGFWLGETECSALDLMSEVPDNTEDTQEFNTVTKPKHYQLFPEFNIEVKHVVALLCNRLGTNGYSGAFIADFAQMLQYLMRFDEKNGKEDLEKAKEFLSGMLEKYPDVQTLKGQK